MLFETQRRLEFNSIRIPINIGEKSKFTSETPMTTRCMGAFIITVEISVTLGIGYLSSFQPVMLAPAEYFIMGRSISAGRQ